jgi:DDE superfamily endonuclease
VRGQEDQQKGREIDAWYSGKAHEPAGNVQALAAPGGVPLWVSDVLPGSTHDVTAARELVLPQARLYLKDLPFLADSGYQGAGAGVHVPVKKARPRRTRYRHENPQRAAALRALPGRTRFRADVPAVARPAARHGQPGHDRRNRQSRARPGAIRAQDDQLKVAEKTSLTAEYWIQDSGRRWILFFDASPAALFCGSATAREKLIPR